ncbi:MAG: Gfo/Idh/MocA family oxidoreductase, partial [Actinomycetota bacterium]|nr:Gfo/Idh/MocA family oxidoreductase [Actinomycetota bacterium]
MAPPPGTLLDGQVRTPVESRVVIVGLGQAAGFTVAALAGLPDVRIVAGVDPLSRDALVRLPPGTPLFASLGDVPSSIEADVAVVATPTDTHVEVCREVLDRMISVRRILCEKPLSTSYRQVRSALDRANSTGVRLEVLYHYAFAPEVSWLAARWRAIETAHGFVAGLSARFDDPKESVRTASATLVSSWADSGINALSVLARFVKPGRISGASDGAPAVCRATLEYESGGHAGEG